MVGVNLLLTFIVPPFYQTQAIREVGILGSIEPAKPRTPKFDIKKSKNNINKIKPTIDNNGKYAIKI
jgi:hypothetical protein